MCRKIFQIISFCAVLTKYLGAYSKVGLPFYQKAGESDKLTMSICQLFTKNTEHGVLLSNLDV